MKHLRNKIFLAIAFLAAGLFLSVSLGGEFLHQKVHHHESKTSYDDCPVHQLLVQTLLVAVAAAFCLPKINIGSIVSANKVFISRQEYLLPSLRAPPVSL